MLRDDNLDPNHHTHIVCPGLADPSLKNGPGPAQHAEHTLCYASEAGDSTRTVLLCDACMQETHGTWAMCWLCSKSGAQSTLRADKQHPRSSVRPKKSACVLLGKPCMAAVSSTDWR